MSGLKPTTRVKPRQWKCIAPDGREWLGDSALAACAAAHKDTIDPQLAMQRILERQEEERTIVLGYTAVAMRVVDKYIAKEVDREQLQKAIYNVGMGS